MSLTDENVDPSTTPEDSFYPESKPDVTADPSPANSETPVDKTGAVQTEAAPEPADTDTEPDQKSKSPRSSWADMRQARYRAEAEVELLKKQLEERNKAASLPAPSPVESTPVAAGKPVSDDYALYDDYLDARDLYNRTQWESEQAAKQRQAEEAKAADQAKEESAKLVERFNAREKVVQAVSPNYDANFKAFFAVAQQVPALGAAVFASELSPDVADHLGAHPDELQRIVKLAPGRIWAEVGKLEDKLSSKGSTPPVTQAPRPLQDVGGTAGRAPKEKSDEESFYGAN